MSSQFELRARPQPTITASPRIVPFALLIAGLVLASYWSAISATLPDPLRFDGVWLYALRSFAAGLALIVLWPRLAELRFARPATLGPWLEAVIIGVGVFLAWITLGPLLRVGQVNTSSPWPDDPLLAGLWIAFRLIGSVLVVPIAEELFWRSYVMRRIDRAEFATMEPRKASLFAVVLSSLVFAVAHRELAAALIAGLAYAWLYRAHGNLRLAVAAHAITNALLAAYVLAWHRWDFW